MNGDPNIVLLIYCQQKFANYSLLVFFNSLLLLASDRCPNSFSNCSGKVQNMMIQKQTDIHAKMVPSYRL